MSKKNKIKHNSKIYLSFSLIIALVLYLSINIIFNLTLPLKFDFTENQRFTLSKGTHEILKNIKEPIELHFFLSEQLIRDVPDFVTYSQRVSDLLDEIQSLSIGKIQLYRYNPKQYSAEEEQANTFGIQPIPIIDDQVGYFGLAVKKSSDNQTKLIEFFHPDRETHLEYDIISIIYALSKQKRHKIGIMSSLPVMGNMSASVSGVPMIPWRILSQLRSGFDLTNLPEKIDDLPQSIDTMILVQPFFMNERSVYELEQFLFRGGSAIIFIDPKTEPIQSFRPNTPSSPNLVLNRLFDAWGINIPKNELVADRSLALRINAGTAIKPLPADYLMWLNVKPEYITKDDPVTAQLSAVNLATSGHIIFDKNTSLKIKPLIVSSKNSNLLKASDVDSFKPDVFGMLANFKPDTNAYILAARLTGNVNSAFPNGAPKRVIKKAKSSVTQENNRTHLDASLNPINVILVADTDMLQDRFWFVEQQFYGRTVEQEISSNGKFLINAVENLTGNDELLNLRTRGSSHRPFEKIEQIKHLSEIKFLDKQRKMQNKLRLVQLKINQLKGIETIKNANTGELEVKVSLTGEQRQEIQSMRNEMLEIRKQLREIQFKLNMDLNSLQTWIHIINIGLVPSFIILLIIIIGVFRTINYHKRYHTAKIN